MNELYEIMKNYSINDAIEQEKNDLQFIALKELFENIKNKEVYLFLVLSNALITYQLSGKWEAYWKEFSQYFQKINNLDLKNLIEEEIKFISNSKNNKRLLDVKIQRLNKIGNFIDNFQEKKEFYYENMEILRNELANLMNQKKDAKTIVFAVKMFSYAARNYFKKIILFPSSIEIPIDSRLENIFALYNIDKYMKISDFYKILSWKLDIPALHLDALIWCNYEELIKKNK